MHRGELQRFPLSPAWGHNSLCRYPNGPPTGSNGEPEASASGYFAATARKHREIAARKHREIAARMAPTHPEADASGSQGTFSTGC